jgi:hypothetical protein
MGLTDWRFTRPTGFSFTRITGKKGHSVSLFEEHAAQSRADQACSAGDKNVGHVMRSYKKIPPENQGE